MSEFSPSPPDKDIQRASSAGDAIAPSFSNDGLSFGLGRPGTFDDLDDVETLDGGPSSTTAIPNTTLYTRPRLDEDTLGSLGMLKADAVPLPPTSTPKRKHPRLSTASTAEDSAVPHANSILASYSVDMNGMMTLGSSSLDALHDLFRSNTNPALGLYPSTTASAEEFYNNMQYESNKRMRSTSEALSAPSVMITSAASISDTEYIRPKRPPYYPNEFSAQQSSPAMMKYYNSNPPPPYSYSNYNPYPPPFTPPSFTNNSNNSSSNRGKYRCGRCGQPKVNHVCLFVEITDKRSIATSTTNPLFLTPAQLALEKTIVVGKNAAADTTTTKMEELRGIKIIHPSMLNQKN